MVSLFYIASICKTLLVTILNLSSIYIIIGIQNIITFDIFYKLTMTKKSNYTKKYYVKGMHCKSCELLIKQDIESMSGVKKVDVLLRDSCILIDTKDPLAVPSIEHLNTKFQNKGYSFSESESIDKSFKADTIKVVALAILFVISFYFFEKSKLAMNFSLTPTSSVLGYFLFGVIAGLSSCAALVGGLLLALSKNWTQAYQDRGSNKGSKATNFLYFNISRIITFALFGGLLGYLGSFFKISIVSTAILTIVISIVMIILALQMLQINWLNRFNFNLLKDNRYLNRHNLINGKYTALIVGSLTFFVPCGFTMIAQTNAVNAGSFYQGMFFLGAFALGTFPTLALISFTSIKFYSNTKFSKNFSTFSGVVILFLALYNFNSQLNVLGLKSLNDLFLNKPSDVLNTSNAKVDDKNNQTINITATGFEYLPKQITIKSGLNTKLKINNIDAIGCAQTAFANGLYDKVIPLKPGLNTVEFIAPKTGTYKISCSMGMVDPVVVRVE